MKLPDGFEIDPLETVHPMMAWVTAWGGVALPPHVIEFFAAAGIDVEPDPPALFLISEQGHRVLVPDAGPELAGHVVHAYTGQHALFLLPGHMATCSGAH